MHIYVNVMSRTHDIYVTGYHICIVYICMYTYIYTYVYIYIYLTYRFYHIYIYVHIHVKSHHVVYIYGWMDGYMCMCRCTFHVTYYTCIPHFMYIHLHRGKGAYIISTWAIERSCGCGARSPLLAPAVL